MRRWILFGALLATAPASGNPFTLAKGSTDLSFSASVWSIDRYFDGDDERACKYWSDVDSSLTNAHRRLRELITYFRSRMDPQGLLHALGEI